MRSTRFILNTAWLLILSALPVTAHDGHVHSDANDVGFIHTNRVSAVELEKPSEQESFTFAIFGDRTGGPESGLAVLERAVSEVNTIGPDLVMTVGDLVEGYNQRLLWIKQTMEFKMVMNRLDMAWFPVAGNHDVYWRGPGRPENEHDGNYESYFGPLWYAFEHKGCWFIVLYSDEGNPETGEKNFGKAECQKMSPEQTQWLEETLTLTKGAKHVFLFLHHPRWTGGRYGNDWDRIHAILKKAGNVSAVFAGHTHRMKFNGVKDNIEYYTLATTGGHVPSGEINPLKGQLHHYDLVTVRGDEFRVAAVPVGGVIDPKSKRISRILMTERPWMIRNEATRRLRYPIKLQGFDGPGAILRIGVAHGYDDSGDRGVQYELRNKEDEIVQRGYLNGYDYEWIKYPVGSGAQLEFVLVDEDTSFEGRSAGNGGKIQVELDVVLSE